MPLNDRQRRFVEAYLLEPNATRAAIDAGYSPRTARSIGAENLTKPDIAAALAEGRARLSATTGITPERVLAELAKLGFADIRQVVQWRARVSELEEDEDGEPQLRTVNEVVITDSDQLSNDAAAAIVEVSQSKDGMLKVKLHDKLGALTKIGQHLGMFRPASADEQPGKKEKAQKDAESAGLGSDWGDDLHVDVAPNRKLRH